MDLDRGSPLSDLSSADEKEAEKNNGNEDGKNFNILSVLTDFSK
jgi:hypothetical protein